jgi:hypothetical protein
VAIWPNSGASVAKTSLSIGGLHVRLEDVVHVPPALGTSAQ